MAAGGAQLGGGVSAWRDGAGSRRGEARRWCSDEECCDIVTNSCEMISSVECGKLNKDDELLQHRRVGDARHEIEATDRAVERPGDPTLPRWQRDGRMARDPLRAVSATNDQN